jgi:hypothetical protein
MSSLSKPKGGQPIPWDRELFDELDRCVLADLSVRQISRRLGCDNAVIARGACLRLREILLALHRAAA